MPERLRIIRAVIAPAAPLVVAALLLFLTPRTACAVDSTPPTNIASVSDTNGVLPDEIDATTSANTLYAVWAPSSDPESGVAKYYYCIGTSPGLCNTVAWTDNGAPNNMTRAGLVLTQGAWYYVSVKAQNGAGLQSAVTSSDGVRVDSTVPTTPTFAYDGIPGDIDATQTAIRLTGNWGPSSDPQTGIARYLYAVGTAPGGTNVIGWTDNGLTQNFSRDGMNLSVGTTYYITVVAENGAGMTSAQRNSDGVLIQADTTPPAIISTRSDVRSATQTTDLDWTYLSNNLQAVWSPADDPECGIQNYWYSIGTTAGASNVVGWTNTPVNYFTRSGLALTNGQIYYATVKAVNKQGLISSATSTDGITVDTSPPSNLTYVYDGTGADVGTWPNAGEMSANWSTSTDAQSGMYGYRYCLGTAPGSCNTLAWTGVGTAYVTHTGLSLTNGQTYYFSVKAENNAGGQSAAFNSNGFQINVTDGTPPTNVPSVTDEDYTSATNTLIAYWEPSDDPQSGISHYWYCLGTSQGATNTKNWTDTGTDTTAIAEGLTLAPGVTYYFTVKAQNGAGLMSGVTYSGGVMMDTTAPTNIAAVNDGVGADIDTTGSYTQLSANWAASSDAQSGIKRYLYAIGTTAGATNTVPWTYVPATWTTITKSGLSLVSGTTYYFTVKAQNGAGLYSNTINTDGQTVVLTDGTPPAYVQVVNDGDYTSVTTQLQASWSESWDDETGIAKYWYAIGTASGAIDTATWTDNALENSVTRTGLALVNGTKYYVSVKAQNGAGLYSTPKSGDGVTVDTTAPANVAWVYDGGGGGDIDTATSSNTLSSYWAASSDAQSGVALYAYAIGTAPGATNVVNWTGVGTDTYVTKSGLTLIQGTTYYFSVKAQNGAGLQSGAVNSDGALVDIVDPTPPTYVESVDDGDYTSSTSQLTANWSTAYDPETGIAKYWYAIGTASGATDIVGWTDNGTNRSVTHTSLSLTSGTTYYFTVKAENGKGLQSSPKSSDGVMVDSSPPATIGTVNDGTGADIGTTTSATQISANWTTSSDAQSGVTYYWYAVGTTAGGINVVPWTNNATDTYVTHGGLNLTNGQIYYFTVRAENGAGLFSTPANSNGQTVSVTDGSPPATITLIYDGDYTSVTTQLTADWEESIDPESGIAKYWYSIGTTAGASNTAAWTDNGQNTTGLKTGLALVSGTTYYWTVKAQNGVGLMSTPYTADGIRVDTSPPGAIASVNDGTGADVDSQTSLTQISANWSASSEPQSAIVAYYYAIGTASGSTNTVNWTNNGTSLSFTRTGLTLVNGTTYYVTVKALNAIDLWSPQKGSDGVTATSNDVTPPANIAYVNDEGYTSSTTELYASWSASSDAESGIKAYWYSIGTTAGASNTVVWTSVGAQTSVTKTGLALAQGQTYYFTVKAENGAGLFSGVKTSTGVVVDTTGPTYPANVYDGTGVDIDVTYAESTLSANWDAAADATSGIEKYWYCIGTASGTSDFVNWTNNGPNTYFTRTGLNLQNGTTYYVTVKAENGSELQSSAKSSDGALVTIDTTAPTQIATVNDGAGADEDVTFSTTQLVSNWSASSDPVSGVARYWYSIGTAPGAPNFVDWTDNSINTNVTKNGLTLNQCTTYYVNVKAENGAGLFSTPTYSDGILAAVNDFTPPVDVATVYDGSAPAADDDVFYSSATFYANWTAASDPDSGICTNYYAIGTSAGATDTLNWTMTGGTSFQKSGLAMTNGTTYYVSVKAVNGNGTYTNVTTSDGTTLQVDPTPPVAVATVNDGLGADTGVTTSTTQLSANWTTTTDPESGLVRYWYAIGTTAGATNTVNWTGNMLLTNVTHGGLSLTPGQTYYFSIRAENGSGGMSTPTNSNGQTVQLDATPPSNVMAVRDGGGGDIDLTGETTMLRANWDTATDEDSGIAFYWYSIGTTVGASNTVGWSTTTNAAITKTGLALVTGQMYYFSVKAQNGSGLMSAVTANSDGALVDGSAPANIVSVFDGSGADVDTTTSWTQLAANWSGSSDAQSGIAKYWYAIGTAPGATDVINWTNNNLNTSATQTNLTLTNNETYYFSVKAENGVGLYSGVTSSDGITVQLVDSTPPSNVGAVVDGVYTSNTQIAASWSAASDAESGITGYWYSMGSVPGASDVVAWTQATTTNVTRTGLTLTQGNTYYVAVRAINGVGLTSAAATYSDGVLVDSTEPFAIATVNDGTGADENSTTVLTSISGNWSTTSDAESGIVRYWYAIGTSAGATDTRNWTNADTATGATYTGALLNGGTTYYFTVRAENGAGLLSNPASSNGSTAQVDISAPSNILTVNDGPGADIDVTGSLTTMAMNWSASVDAESGIAKYWYSVGTFAGASDTISWTNNGPFASVTVGGLSLVDGQNYYVTIKSQNGVGLQSGSTTSDGVLVTVDTTAPAMIATVNDGLATDTSVTGYSDRLMANWTASTDAESGIESYWFAMGTTPGGTELMGWTSVGTNRSINQSGLTLTHGQTYYISAKARNGAGLFGPARSSNGQKVDLTAPSTPTTRDGQNAGVDIDVHTSNTEFSCNWDVATEAESSIQKYSYAIGTTPGASNTINWTDVGLTYAVTRGGLNLTHGVTYYCSVRAVNTVGLTSNTGTSDGAQVQISDATPPSKPAVVNDGGFAGLTTELSASWAPSIDTETGIAKYWYSIGTFAGASDVVAWTDNGPDQSVTKTGLSLTNNNTYYWTVKGQNGVGLTSAVATSSGVLIDTTPPANVPSVNDGMTGEIDITTNLTQLSANWATSTDLNSGIVSYWFAMGTATSATNVVDWTNNGVFASIAVQYLSLTPGVTYYSSVKAKNGAGLFSAANTVSDGVTAQLDVNPPPTPAWIRDGSNEDVDYTLSTSQLTANWAETDDPESGLRSYWYSVGTAPGASDTVPWTDAGNYKSITKTGLTLATNTTYYFSVKTEDNYHLFSSATSSDGVVVEDTAPATPSYVYDGTGADIDTATSVLELSANWGSATDAQSGIMRYSYGIGTATNTATGVIDVVNWTDVGLATGVTRSDLSLTNGETYYVSVKAFNGAAMVSEVVSSDGQTIDVVDTTPPPDVTIVHDGDFAGSLTQLSMSWPPTTDFESGIAHYWYAIGTASGTTDVRAFTDNSTSTYATATGLALTNGNTYYVTVKAENGVGLQSNPKSGDGVIIDVTPPSTVPSVSDGMGADIDLTSALTELSANWAPATDATSGITNYWYAFGTAPGATNVVDWTNNGAFASAAAAGLSLTPGQTYYASVIAVNGAGLSSATATWSDGVLAVADATAPSAPTVIYDGLTTSDIDFTGSTSTLSANWDYAYDPETGIAGYWYSIGTAFGASDVVQWTSVGENRSISKSGLSLTGGQMYYFSVKAENGAGMMSTATNSDGLYVDTTQPSTPAFVYDGTGADIDYATSATSLSANWGVATDAQSGVVRYWYTIGTSPGATDTINWTNNGSATGVVRSSLALNEGSSYFFSVKAENGVYMLSFAANTDGVTIDSLPPAQASWSPAKGATIYTATPTISLFTNENAYCRWALDDLGYASMTQSCGGGGTTGHSCTASGLLEGTDYVYVSCKDNLDNLDTLVTNDNLNYQVDLTTPVQSGWSPATGTYLATTTPIITLSTSENSSCKWSLSDLSYASMTFVCAGAGTVSHSCSTTGLSQGAEYVYVACTDGGNAHSATTNSDLLYTVDTSAPGAVATVNDGTGADISTTSSGTQLSANWSAASDAQSGIARYRYAIGTSAGATNTVDWADIGTATGVTHTGLALTSSTTYYFSVKAENNAGLVSSPTNSNGQMAVFGDPTPPTDIGYVNDGGGADISYTGSTTYLSANWGESTDAESGIARYWYSIGATAGASDVVSWSNNSTARSVTKSGLTLNDAQTYYFNVKAQNGAGLMSNVTSSNGQVVDSSPPTDVATVNDSLGADADIATSTFQLEANWSASTDAQSGVYRYWYAIGTSPGATDTINWTNTGTSTYVTRAGLSLTDGATYYFSVKADNNVLLSSSPASSDGRLVDASPPSQAAWNPAKGATVATTTQSIALTSNENATCKWSLTDQAYGSMTNTCAGGGGTNHTCAATGLVEGAEYVYIACVDTWNNADTAGTNEHVNYTVDVSTPVQSAWNPADNAKVNTTSPSITLTTNENATCRWSLTDQAYGSMANTCDITGGTGHTCNTSGLIEGAEVVYLACTDGYNSSTASDNTELDYTVDTTPPSAVGGVNDGTGADIDVVNSGTQLSANWSAAADAQSGIYRYWFAIGTTSGGTEVLTWTDNGAMTTVTKTGLALSDGQMYYYSVKAENGAGLLSTAVNSDGQLVTILDSTPPTSPGALSDGAGADADLQASTSTITANWTASSDPETGIARYWYAIGATAGATNVVDWTDNGAALTFTHPGLTLTHAQKYYVSVKAENGEGMQSTPSNSDGITVDATPPDTISSVNDGTGSDIDITTSITQLSAIWNASSDLESGVSKYWYAIGTAPGNTDVSTWTDNGTVRNITRGGLVLTDGQMYYFTVKAENGVGRISDVRSSDGARVDVSAPLQSNWSPANGSTATSTNVAISFNTSENASCKWSQSDLGHASMTASCSGGGTSQTCYTTGLPTGAVSIYLACSDTYNADTALTNTGLNYTIDIAPPVQSAWNPASGSKLTSTSATLTLNTDENGWCKWSLTDQMYDSMSNTCAGGGGTSHSCPVTGMVEGTEYVYIACRDTWNNKDLASTNSSVSWVVDTTPPTSISYAYDGVGADISETTSAVELSSNWAASVDSQSGIGGYWYSIGTTAGASNTVSWTNNGVSTSVTRTGLALSQGITYYFTIKAENGVGLMSTTISTNGQTVIAGDATPPSDVATVNDGTGADVDLWGSTSQLSANWSASSDAESGIAKYWYSLGATAGASDAISWTSNGTNLNFTRGSLLLTDGATYYLSVKAENGAGLKSNVTTADGFVIDATPPSAVTVSDGTGADSDATNSSTQLSANWTASADAQSGIAKYWYAIGTTPGDNNVVNWTNNAVSTSVTHTGLTLNNGQIYYFSVRAENGAGLYTASNSDGITVDTAKPVQSAWAPAFGATIYTAAPAVTLTTNENATCRWALTDLAYGSMVNACGITGGTNHTCSATGLPEGAASVFIACTDAVGNADTIATNKLLSYTVDTTAPVQSAWNPASASYLGTTSPTITLTTNETATCKWSLTDQAYGSMLDTCAGGGTAQTCATSGLSLGAEIVYIACSDGTNSHSAANNTELSYTVDTTAPAVIATVNDGTGADSDLTTTGIELSANWSATTDAESGVTKYWYAIGTSAGATNTVNWTNNGTNTSVTRTGLALTDGLWYYFTVKAENGAGLTSTAANSNGILVDVTDVTAPTNVASVYDGTGADIAWTGSTTQLSANWSASSDPESGVAKYWYAIGTTAGGSEVTSWTDNGNATGVTHTGLTLTNAQTYYFTVKSQNGAGSYSSGVTNSNGQTVDTTPPANVATVNDGTGSDIDVINTTTQLSGIWGQTSDSQSGVAKYWYAVGTTAGGTELIAWTDNGINTIFTRTGLTLTDGQEYFVSVKAENTVGGVSGVTTSDGQTVDISPPTQSGWSPATGTVITTSTKSIMFTTNESANCKWSLSDLDYSSMTASCTPSGLNQTCFVSGLVDGAETIYTACYDGYNANSAANNTELAYTVDTQPPVQSNWNPAKGAAMTSAPANMTLTTNEAAWCKWSLTDQSYGSMTVDCAGGGGTSHTCALSGLVEGTEYVYVSCKDANNVADSASTNDNVNYLIDSTPPSTVSLVKDGTGVDVDYTNSTSQLSANWNAATDGQSGVTRYWYAIGTTAGGTNVIGWTNNGTNTSVTATGLSLTNGQTYYFTVKSENGVGLQSPVINSDGATADFNLPTQSAWSPAKSSLLTSTSQTITLTTNENASCRWALTDGSYSSMTSDCAGAGTTSQTCNVSGLSEGAEMVYISCTDAAGNADTAGTNDDLDYTVDSLPPVQSAWSPAKGAYVGSSSQAISFTTNETASCRWALTDLAYDSMATACGAGGSTSHTCSTSGLVDGAEVVYVACADANSTKDTAGTNEDINYIVDTTAPSDPAAVNDGTGADVDVIYTGTQLSANWSASTDAQSGIARYWYAVGTTAGASDVVAWTDNATAAAVTRTGMSLIDNQMYYFSVKAENGAGLISAAVNSDGQLADYTDSTPPSAPTAVSDGTGSDADYTSSTTQLSANWTAGSDPESGVAKYWYSIGTTAGASDTVSWTNNGTNTSVTKTGLTLTNGQTYYTTVKAENGVGLLSTTVSSDGQTVDTTAPSAPGAVSDGTGADVDVTYTSTQLSANWTASTDAQSGIARYWYAIGTTAGGTEVLGWTDNGTAAAVTRTGLTLSNGVTYYFTVKAENGAGLIGSAANSDGQAVDQSTPSQSAWSPASGSTLPSTSQAVTLTTNEAATCRWALTDLAYGGMTNTCTGGGSTSHSCAVTGLSEGANSVYIACSDGQGNDDTVDSNTALSYTVDTTRPVQSAWSPASGSTLGTTSPTITLTTSENATCRWALTDSDYGSMTNTCSGGGSTAHTCSTSGLSLGAEVVYIACGDGVNADSAANNTELSYTVDTTAPATIATVSDGLGADEDDGTSGTALSANWAASSDAESGIVRYWFAIGTTAGASNTLSWTSNGANISVTQTGLALTSGQTYYFTVKAENGAGLMGTPANSDGLTTTFTDGTPPTSVSEVNDGTSTDVDVSGSTTQLAANWTAASDPESGIAIYWYAIGTTSGGTEILGWTNNGQNTSVTKTGLTLTDGQTYYFSVKAENGMGSQSPVVNSDGQMVDSSAPTTVANVNDGTDADVDKTGSSTTLSANWTASADAQSDISRYWYAIGTTAGGTEVSTWTDNGAVTTVTRSGLTLSNGGVYYFSVKAENGAGLTGTPANSDGVTVDLVKPVQSAWSPTYGATINTAAPTVTLTTDENGECRWALTDSAYGSMTNTCSGGGGTSHSCPVSGLSEGAASVYVACADMYGNEQSASDNKYLSYTVDTTPPTQSAWSPASGSTVSSSSTAIAFTTNETATCRWAASDLAYGSMANSCSGGGGTSHSCPVTGLVDGANSVYLACVDASGNADTDSTNDVLSITVDTTPPTDVATVNDGIAADIDSAATLTQLSANWTSSSDAQSGVAEYWYAIGTTVGGSDIVTWTSNGLALSVTKTGLSLTNGAKYYVSIRAENGAGLLSNAVSSDGVTTSVTDPTPPSDIATVNDGTGADVDAQGSTTSLSANWSESTDAESGVTAYWYSVGTSAGATNTVNWTNNGTATSVTITGLTLVNGNTYYFSVKAQNGSSVESNTASSDGVAVNSADVTAPSAVSAVNDGTGADSDVTSSTTQLSANWTAASDPESGVAAYWYAIGTSAGATNTVNWTNAGAVTSVTKTGLTLTSGQTYYFSVKAENGVGLMSSAVNSDGAIVSSTGVDEVTGLTAVSGDGEVQLSWQNPDSGSLAGVKIIRKTGGYPSSATDGTEVYNGTGEFVLDSGLTNGTTYYYAAFAYDSGMNYSTASGAGARATATPTEPKLEFTGGWNLISVPKQTATLSPASVFTGVYEFLNVDGATVEILTGQTTINLSINKPYWVFSDVDLSSISVSGTDYSGASYQITLATGWNFVSNPFADAIEWGAGKATMQCGASSESLPDVFGWENDAWLKVTADSGAKLVPWKGYWMKSPAGNCTLTLFR